MQILVTGATGNLGFSVIETLLKNIPTENISAFVRGEEKISEIKAKGIMFFREIMIMYPLSKVRWRM
ncbi:polysaccharide biosynthesis protein [Zobellia galactanivorans]|uniref:polysaccharide biosynthesis protein n=1 Tax=Zobellia galactanivorans (strain DSM 12802 / CCUG 47099 / CIP 106680 / NCIMB 13871 / Dsij) TaxID=63186 RepID=UPI001C0715DA|nr:polysaccharide biosynthesis protein [Zobellia galactanivorans]MBU3026019.1 polysaccharide biosynthesis protein [Zobellia galactanivorans]